MPLHEDITRQRPAAGVRLDGSLCSLIEQVRVCVSPQSGVPLVYPFQIDQATSLLMHVPAPVGQRIGSILCEQGQAQDGVRRAAVLLRHLAASDNRTPSSIGAALELSLELLQLAAAMDHAAVHVFEPPSTRIDLAGTVPFPSHYLGSCMPASINFVEAEIRPRLSAATTDSQRHGAMLEREHALLAFLRAPIVSRHHLDQVKKTLAQLDNHPRFGHPTCGDALRRHLHGVDLAPAELRLVQDALVHLEQHHETWLTRDDIERYRDLHTRGLDVRLGRQFLYLFLTHLTGVPYTSRTCERTGLSAWLRRGYPVIMFLRQRGQTSLHAIAARHLHPETGEHVVCFDPRQQTLRWVLMDALLHGDAPFADVDGLDSIFIPDEDRDQPR